MFNITTVVFDRTSPPFIVLYSCVFDCHILHMLLCLVYSN